MLGYAYSPRVLLHDPPPPTIEVAGRDLVLGTANVAQAALTAQAHELVQRSALGPALVPIEPLPAPEEALLAVHTPRPTSSGCAPPGRAARGTASTRRSRGAPGRPPG